MALVLNRTKNKHIKIIFFSLVMSVPVLSSAACCSCISDYMQIVAKEGIYATSIASLTSKQMEEKNKVDGLVAREKKALTNERITSELFSQARNIDSAGFAFLMARVKAESLLSDSERMRMMTKGFQQSEEEANAIIKDYENATVSR